jgi:type II secretory pathway component PulJ
MRDLLFKKHTRSFTLLEVLISLAIFIIISAGIYNVLLIGQKTFNSGVGIVDLQSQMRLFISSITRELREAKTFSIALIDDDDDSITFSTPNESSITYYRDVADLNGDGLTNQIIREYPLGTRRVVANNISSLEFLADGNVVEIRLTAAKNADGRQLQLTSITKVEARNE